MVSKFISGAVLAGAVTASVAVSGGAALAATPTTASAAVHAQARSQVYLVCDGIDAVIGCRYPSSLPYGFAGSFYGGGAYFAYDRPGFGDWWGDNCDDYGYSRWGNGPRWRDGGGRPFFGRPFFGPRGPRFQGGPPRFPRPPMSFPRPMVGGGMT